jgi:hypothetical protein
MQSAPRRHGSQILRSRRGLALNVGAGESITVGLVAGVPPQRRQAPGEEAERGSAHLFNKVSEIRFVERMKTARQCAWPGNTLGREETQTGGTLDPAGEKQTACRLAFGTSENPITTRRRASTPSNREDILRYFTTKARKMQREISFPFVK